MAQMRQIFYGRRKLAIALIGSGSPQCCRRRCTVGGALAARLRVGLEKNEEFRPAAGFRKQRRRRLASARFKYVPIRPESLFFVMPALVAGIHVLSGVK
jgi:hypothetical protein